MTQDTMPQETTEVTSTAKKSPKTRTKKGLTKRRTTKRSAPESNPGQAKFPRHAVDKALRIPRAILEQNAGKPCTPKEAAGFSGVGYHGPFSVEIGSSSKYGFLDRPEKGKIQPSELAKRILRPHDAKDELQGYREAILNAPDISDVYKHYRGENIPDDEFFKNTVVDTYKVPEDRFIEFKQIFIDSLNKAQLLSRSGDKLRVVDAAIDESPVDQKSDRIKKLGAAVTVAAGDTCFVMQPFAAPLGDYYEKIYEPAICKAGLKPVRADADIFGTGKIMDQVWSGINSAKILVAELTTRNPNVFYELGLAHALNKPVVLVSSNEDDVPFDLHHIRVIYYDVTDPFWGNKLIEKVAENILSALKNPEEAVFKGGTK